MEDHFYTTLMGSRIDDPVEYIGDMETSTADITVEEKDGDNYLIELYRERQCLYNKSHRDFKNKLIKENAWSEISTIMQEKNLGKYYTPEYCQTRCTSLRDQYSREKRNIENDYKSGSACSKRKTFAFLSQLSFLDNFIQRRKTFSNVEKKNIPKTIKDSETVNSISHGRNNNNECTDKSSSEQVIIKMPLKRNISTLQDASENKENITQNKNDTRDKEIPAPKLKKSKIDQSKNIDETFTSISNAIINLLEDSKEQTTTRDTRLETRDSIKSVDQSFADYVRVHLENIPEPEKSERKKLIIDALTAPLHKT